MAISPYDGPSARNSRFGLWVIEACLALSVIAGLSFVTLRVMNMPEITPDTAAVTTDAPPSAPETVVVTTAASDIAGTKTQ